MPFVAFSAFAVFFICCALQFWFQQRIVRALATRHPGLWLAMSGKAFFIQNAVLRFANRRQDRGLGDADLTRKVQQLRLVYLVAILAWLVFAGSLLTMGGWSHQPL